MSVCCLTNRRDSRFVHEALLVKARNIESAEPGAEFSGPETPLDEGVDTMVIFTFESRGDAALLLLCGHGSRSEVL